MLSKSSKQEGKQRSCSCALLTNNSYWSYSWTSYVLGLLTAVWIQRHRGIEMMEKIETQTDGKKTKAEMSVVLTKNEDGEEVEAQGYIEFLHTAGKYCTDLFAVCLWEYAQTQRVHNHSCKRAPSLCCRHTFQSVLIGLFIGPTPLTPGAGWKITPK